MASNLRLLDAEIPLGSTQNQVSAAADTGYGLTNLWGGARSDHFRLATAASGDTRISFDLGSTSSNWKTANVVFLSKAILLKNNFIGTITIKGHTADSYAGATTVATLSSFTSATMTGAYAEDYLTTFTLSSSYRYWWVNYNATSASQVQHGKLFLGTGYDPGRDPDTVSVERIAGTHYQRKPYYRYQLSWSKLPYATAVIMMNRFAKVKETNGIVLYTTSAHQLLNTNYSVHGRVTAFTSPQVVTSFVDVSMTVEEFV